MGEERAKETETEDVGRVVRDERRAMSQEEKYNSRAEERRAGEIRENVEGDGRTNATEAATSGVEINRTRITMHQVSHNPILALTC